MRQIFLGGQPQLLHDSLARVEADLLRVSLSLWESRLFPCDRCAHQEPHDLSVSATLLKASTRAEHMAETLILYLVIMERKEPIVVMISGATFARGSARANQCVKLLNWQSNLHCRS